MRVSLTRAMTYGFLLTMAVVWLVVILGIILQDISGDSSYMARGACMRWDPYLVWGTIITDGLIWIDYWLIPLTLGLAVWFELQVSADPKYQASAVVTSITALLNRLRYPSGTPWGVRLRFVAVLTLLFIFFCGTGHLIDLISVWYARPWLKLVNNAGTALVSTRAAMVAIRNFPFFVDLVRTMAETEHR